MMEVDVVIIGGAYAGASAGLLLKRRNPAWRVMIIEKSERFGRKVGESTTEVSSRFMTAVLGITSHLGHHQLNKQGLRMWFNPPNAPDFPFDRCAEVGSRNNSRLSGFQVDRSVLDEHILALAQESGCLLRRPAKIVAMELGGEGNNEVTIDYEGNQHQIRARWVVDASGRAAMIARKKGLYKALTEHPINSIWARFKGVRDWDCYEMRQQHPAYARACNTGRQWATNHLTGYGWWCWIIPLKGGDTSIGLVYDRRLYTPPEGANLTERLKKHLLLNPVGRELLSNVEAVPGDVHAYSQLAYSVSEIVGDGWILAGDAAGFLDPFYSPGLDFCSYTAHHVQSVVGDALEGRPPDAAALNARFGFCFHSWFQAIYRDKYYYIGDAELMYIAFLLDIGSYHLGPVREVFGCSSRYSEFPFHGKPGRLVARLLTFFNERLVIIAQKKKAAGTWGDLNQDSRLLIGGFLPDKTSAWLFLRGAGRWLRAEARAWRLSKPPTPPHSADASDVRREEATPVATSAL